MQLDQKDIISVIVSIVILAGGRYFRNYLLDLWSSVQFILGFIKLLATYGKDVGHTVYKIDASKLTPEGKTLIDQVKVFFTHMEVLLGKVSQVEEPDRKTDSSLITTMAQMVKEYHRRKGLKYDEDKPADKDMEG